MTTTTTTRRRRPLALPPPTTLSPTYGQSPLLVGALYFSSSSSSGPSQYPQLPSNYREHGQELIVQAAVTQSGLAPSQIAVDWTKRGKIIVTVSSDNIVLDDDEIDDDGLWDAYDDSIVNEDDYDDFELDWAEEEEEEDDDTGILVNEDGNDGSVNVVSLARAINAAMEEDAIGMAIAETHEIEVTTPGASDELVGPVMFQAYQGFDVICQYYDSKKKKKNKKKPDEDDSTEGQERPIQTVEGRLYDRDEECTTINLKGRMKKIPNEDIISVKLPKAKREKGVS